MNLFSQSTTSLAALIRARKISAVDVLQLHIDRIEAQKLFNRFDVLLAPAMPCIAPSIGQMTMMIDGLEVPVRPNLGLYTQPISFIGLPVVCVPVAGSNTLPRGVQIITAPGREALGLAVAARLEHAGIVAAPVAGRLMSWRLV